MTTQTEASSVEDTLKLALEAMKRMKQVRDGQRDIGYPLSDADKQMNTAITAIEKALTNHFPDAKNMVAQPAVASEQRSVNEHLKPVAHTAVFHCPNCDYPYRQVTHITGVAQPPWSPQRPSRSDITWVGLTDEDCFEALKAVDSQAVRLPLGFSMFAANIQAKLKEKNS